MVSLLCFCRRDDNKKKNLRFFFGGGALGAERKIVQNVFFVGNVTTIEFESANFIVENNFVVIAQSPNCVFFVVKKYSAYFSVFWGHHFSMSPRRSTNFKILNCQNIQKYAAVCVTTPMCDSNHILHDIKHI